MAVDVMASALLYDLEDLEFAVARLRAQRVPGLIDEMRHVDHGQRIGALHDECTADGNVAQRFFGAQHRLRTAQAAKVEDKLVWLRGQSHRSIEHRAAAARTQCTADAVSRAILSRQPKKKILRGLAPECGRGRAAS